MMNINQVMEKIEDLEFDLRMNIASGYHHFIDILSSDESTVELCSLLHDTDNTARVARRLLDLSSQVYDLEFENSRDVAIATYLWCVYTIDDNIGKYLAEAVLEARNIWWARLVAERILSFNYQPEFINARDRIWYDVSEHPEEKDMFSITIYASGKEGIGELWLNTNVVPFHYAANPTFYWRQRAKILLDNNLMIPPVTVEDDVKYRVATTGDYRDFQAEA